MIAVVDVNVVVAVVALEVDSKRERVQRKVV